MLISNFYLARRLRVTIGCNIWVTASTLIAPSALVSGKQVKSPDENRFRVCVIGAVKFAMLMGFHSSSVTNLQSINCPLSLSIACIFLFRLLILFHGLCVLEFRLSLHIWNRVLTTFRFPVSRYRYSRVTHSESIVSWTHSQSNTIKIPISVR